MVSQLSFQPTFKEQMIAVLLNYSRPQNPKVPQLILCKLIDIDRKTSSIQKQPLQLKTIITEYNITLNTINNSIQ